MKTNYVELCATLLARECNANMERPHEEGSHEYQRIEQLAAQAIAKHPQGGRVLVAPTAEELQYKPVLLQYASEDGVWEGGTWLQGWCALVSPEEFCAHCAFATIYCPRQFEEVAALLNEWTALLHKEGLV